MNSKYMFKNISYDQYISWIHWYFVLTKLWGLKLAQKAGGTEGDLRTKIMFNSCCRTNIFPDAFLACRNLQNSSMPFSSVGDFSLSAEHVTIEQTVHSKETYISLQIPV